MESHHTFKMKGLTRTVNQKYVEETSTNNNYCRYNKDANGKHKFKPCLDIACQIRSKTDVYPK